VRLRNIVWCLFFCLLTALVSAQTGSHPDTSTIVARMLAAQHENKARLQAFTVRRNYQLFDQHSDRKAEIVADITWHPPDQKQYRIESTSGGLGERVLRDVLSKETEPVKERQKHELSQDNYDFQFLREETLEGRLCYVLTLNPRREEKELVRGQIWVDAENYRIHRLEGKTMKSPSWWIRDLYILMTFTDIDGKWLHTSTQAVANIRFRGQYVMLSRDLEYRAADSSQSVPTQHTPAVLAGAVVHR
jgi:hypothetical protein